MTTDALVYRLEGHKAVPADIHDPSIWDRVMDPEYRQVGRTRVGRLEVSTVFMIVNYAIWPGARPQLFETAVFPLDDGPGFRIARRYATWEEAEAGHALTVAEERGLVADEWGLI